MGQRPVERGPMVNTGHRVGDMPPKANSPKTPARRVFKLDACEKGGGRSVHIQAQPSLTS